MHKVSRVNDNQKTLGVAFLVLAALSYSVMPVLIRILGDGGVPPISQVFLRYVFAFMVSCVYIIASKAKLKLKKSDIGILAAITLFGYALTNLFFTYAILYTNVSNALFIFYTYAIIAPVLGYFILKEKLKKAHVAAMLVSLLALYLLFEPNASQTWMIGSIFALFAALGQAFFIVLRRKLSHYSSTTLMFLSTFVGILALGLMSLLFEYSFYFEGGLSSLSTTTWVGIALFGLDNFFAWYFVSKGFEYLKSAVGSMILLTELIFGVFFAFVFFAEVPTLTILLGGALIVYASVLITRKSNNA